VPAMPVAEPGVMAPAPFADIYSAPPPAQGYYPPAYPPPGERDMGGQAVALGLPSQSRLSAPPPPTYPPPAPPPPTPPPAYPPPAYPPPAGYSPSAAYPPAWPAAPMSYRTGSGRYAYARPGFVTTMAVFGIITAALSFLASAFTGCSSAILMAQAKRGAVVMRGGAGMPATAPTMVTPQAAPVSPEGLSAAEARVVVNVLRSRRAITPARQEQLEAFLKEHGKQLLDDPAGALTSRKVYDHLGEVGQEFANPGQTGADFFVIKAGPLAKLPGRLRVFDDRSVFEADDHSGTLRSAAAKDAAPKSWADPDDPGLDDDGAAAIVNKVRADSRNLLNAAQAETLRATLQSPAYSAWVSPSSTIPGLTAQVRSVVVNLDGSVAIAFTMTRVTLDAQGNVVGGAPVPGAATQPIGAPGVTFGALGVDRRSCSMAVAEALLSALLAVFLLVVSILSLRQSPAARRLFLIYAVVKVLCGVVAIVAFAGILSSLNAGNDSFGYARAMATSFGGVARVAITLSAIGLAYPLVVLGAMTLSRTAREYYGAARA
jgi:hypothetical protein